MLRLMMDVVNCNIDDVMLSHVASFGITIDALFDDLECVYFYLSFCLGMHCMKMFQSLFYIG